MGATTPAANVLTDRLLRSWLRCRRRAWLDRHGDPSDRRWTAHRNLQLDDQQRCFVALLPERPGHGEAACAAGAAGVVGLRLKGEGPGGERLEAHPPLLRRVKGQSRWGAPYQPVMASEARMTREHQLPLALMVRLLEQHQQASISRCLWWAAVAVAWNAIGSASQPACGGNWPRVCASCRRTSTATPPPLAAERRKCSLCSWRAPALLMPPRKGISVVVASGAAREMLQQLGIDGLQDLAAADPQQLAGAWHGSGQHGRPPMAWWPRQVSVIALSSIWTLPLLVRNCAMPLAWLYDIESDPDARHDFLHGFLRLPRRPDGSWDLTEATYVPVLVLAEHGEARTWTRVNRLLRRHAGWPVLHYGETETLALRRLAQRQGASDRELKQLKLRLVDVHARIRRHWRLPLSSYGLKAVAAWRGFQWSQPGVDGARALLWWRQWRGTGPDRRGSPMPCAGSSATTATTAWRLGRWPNSCWS